MIAPNGPPYEAASGSQWLKLSEGVVSGAEARRSANWRLELAAWFGNQRVLEPVIEVVEDNMVYQSTAPISPGNSGGDPWSVSFRVICHCEIGVALEQVFIQVPDI